MAMPTPARAAETWPHPLSKEWYLDLARCETANNTRHGYPLKKYSSYVSAFGIYKKTWAAWSDVPLRKVYKLSFAEQAKTVDAIAFYGHTKNGKYKPPAGLYGWGAIRKNCNGLNDQLCKSKHPIIKKIRRCR